MYCIRNTPIFLYVIDTASPSSVETVKAAEPLTTVLIGLLFMRETYSSSTYMSLLPICGGVAMACYNNDAFSVMGFLLAMASNFCFSARAVYTKMLNTTFPGVLDDINLFYNISSKGLVFLVPITALMEGSEILGIIAGDSSSPPSPTVRMPVLHLILLASLNGVMFAVYNLTSYMVLRQTKLVTHSVFNVFRRVFIIVFTSVYFHTPLSLVSGGGIALATIGVLLFGVVVGSAKPIGLAKTEKEFGADRDDCAV